MAVAKKPVKASVKKTAVKTVAKPKPVPAAAKKAMTKRDGIDMKRAAGGYDANSRAIDGVRQELKALKNQALASGIPSRSRMKKEDALRKKLDSMIGADSQYKKMGFPGKVNYNTKKK